MFEEKRQFPRANIHCKISTSFADRLLVFNTHTENISAGGIKVILEEELHVSTVADLEICLLDKEKPLRCRGQIAWVKEMKPTHVKPHLFDTGIKFIGITDAQQNEIGDFVKHVLSQGYDDKK
jgi:c-di-GMP-binding flagellar brake protein YcgR